MVKEALWMKSLSLPEEAPWRLSGRGSPFTGDPGGYVGGLQ